MADGEPEEVDGRETSAEDDGVDRSLVRWMLSLTPTERLAVVQSAIDLVGSVRDVEPGPR